MLLPPSRAVPPGEPALRSWARLLDRDACSGALGGGRKSSAVCGEVRALPLCWAAQGRIGPTWPALLLPAPQAEWWLSPLSHCSSRSIVVVTASRILS